MMAHEHLVQSTSSAGTSPLLVQTQRLGRSGPLLPCRWLPEPNVPLWSLERLCAMRSTTVAMARVMQTLGACQQWRKSGSPGVWVGCSALWSTAQQQGPLMTSSDVMHHHIVQGSHQ